MSDTKWRKLFQILREARPDIDRMTLKFIDGDEAREMRFPPDLRCPHDHMDTMEYGPVALRAIEWIDFPADLSGLLEPIGHFPITAEAGRTRVTGYAHARP